MVPTPPEAVTTTASTLVDLAGVYAAGVLGGNLAARKGLDPVGFAALAIASGLGGGIIRDVLLARGTPLALVEPAYLITALAAAATAFLLDLTGHKSGRVTITLLDATAMAFWAVSGSQRAIAADMEVLTILLLGVITAVGGGVIRDLLAGERPVIFTRQSNALYATSALAAAALFTLLTKLDVPTIISIPAGVLAGFGLRFLSWRYGWRLPDKRHN